MRTSIFSKQLVALLLLAGCSAAPPRPKADHPLPQHLLGAWSAPSVLDGRQPDFVFSQDTAPCAGLVRTRFGNGLSHDTSVQWTAEEDVLLGRSGTEDIARLVYAPDGLRGTLQVSTTEIAGDGNRATLHKRQVDVAGAVRRLPPVRVYPGASLAAYEVDRVMPTGEKQLAHGEVFRYKTTAPVPDVLRFYQSELGSKRSPPAGVRDGRFVAVFSRPGEFEILAER